MLIWLGFGGQGSVLAQGSLILVGALGVRAATLEGVGDWRAVGEDGAMHALTGAGFQDLDWTHSVMAVFDDAKRKRSLVKRAIIRLLNDRRAKTWQSLWAFNFIVTGRKPSDVEGQHDHTEA